MTELIITDADKLWGVAWTYIRTVVDTAREPFLILNKNLEVISVNKTFLLYFLVSEKEVIGKKVYQIGDRQWNIPKLKILLEDILPHNTHFEDFKVEHDFKKIGHRIMLLNARQVFTTDNKTPIILLAMEDVTKQKELEDKLKKYSEELIFQMTKKTKDLEKRVNQLEILNKKMTGILKLNSKLKIKK